MVSIPVTHVSKLYAVVDCKIAKLLTDPSGGTATYDALIDVPGIKNVGLGPEVNAVELRGDNVRLDSDSTLVGMTLSVEHAKISLDALAAMLGGTVTDAGIAPNQTATYKRISTDAFNYFRLLAKTPTNGVDVSGGDVKLEFYKAKVTSISFGLAEEDYQVVSFEASAVYRASDNGLFDLTLRETAAALA